MVLSALTVLLVLLSPVDRLLMLLLTVLRPVEVLVDRLATLVWVVLRPVESPSTRLLTVLGAVDADGELLGFATWGPFRPFPAYKYSMEHSVYVRHDQRGKGLGSMLLQALIARAAEAQVHVLVGCIDAANTRSIRLHQPLGCIHAGTFPQLGSK